MWCGLSGARGGRCSFADFPDETFDAVKCVCTLMFSPDLNRRSAKIRRVLKPGGRFGIVVWDEPSLDPFSMVLVSVMSTFIALPPLPGADAPGPFRFGRGVPADRV